MAMSNQLLNAIDLADAFSQQTSQFPRADTRFGSCLSFTHSMRDGCGLSVPRPRCLSDDQSSPERAAEWFPSRCLQVHRVCAAPLLAQRAMRSMRAGESAGDFFERAPGGDRLRQSSGANRQLMERHGNLPAW
jgi:hypothetical protein